ncbi:MAG: transposase [Patescibacteria group bacterium]
MKEFNVVEPIGSIYEHSFIQLGSRTSKSDKLVNLICYCLNPNHYHFILEPVIDKGIEKFMQRLGGGYTNYFNNKHKRNGVLFQGKFKARHVNSDLLNISVYVNLNNYVHQLGSRSPKLYKSSWDEYKGKNRENFCYKDIILEQFENSNEYASFAKDALEGILERKKEKEEVKSLLIE